MTGAHCPQHRAAVCRQRVHSVHGHHQPSATCCPLCGALTTRAAASAVACGEAKARPTVSGTELHPLRLRLPAQTSSEALSARGTATPSTASWTCTQAPSMLGAALLASTLTLCSRSACCWQGSHCQAMVAVWLLSLLPAPDVVQQQRMLLAGLTLPGDGSDAAAAVPAPCAVGPGDTRRRAARDRSKYGAGPRPAGGSGVRRRQPARLVAGRMLRTTPNPNAA